MKIFINPSSLEIEGNGLQSKEVTLSIGQKVAAHLNASGITTELQQLDSVESIYTSSNNFGADLFVAIHCNAASPTASGTETFYCQGSENGQKLAQSIQSRIIAALGTVDRGIKDDTQSAAGRLGVLRKTTCPAALVETAFISNANDAQILSNKQEEFAQAISSGILDYCGIAAGNNVKPAANVVEEPVPVIDIDFKVIAAQVRKYETKDDIAEVTSDSGDTTYGIYKLSSSKKTIDAFVDWLCHHQDVKLANYGNALAQDTINSEAFIETWKNLATVDPGNFSQLQDEFVKTNYFDKANEALVKEHFHLDKHSDEMKKFIFTHSYQDGVEACVESVKNACKKLGHPNLSYVDDKNFDTNLINSANN